MHGSKTHTPGGLAPTTTHIGSTYRVPHFARHVTHPGVCYVYAWCMCSTCGCGQPFNKHESKDIQAANRKYANPKIKFEAIKAKLKSKRT